MKKYIKDQLFLFFAVFLLSLVLGGLFGGAPASAAPAKIDPGYQKIFDEEICTSLEKITNTTLYDKYCKVYMYQKDLDAAYQKICSVHGAGGTGKLTDECNQYKNYKKGSFKPKSGGVGSSINTHSDPALEKCTNDQCDFIKKYINPFINMLTAAFGLIAVISLVIGGIQYSASGGDPQKVSQAKSRIQNTIVAIVAYFLLYAFLQFLIPGGLFKR